MKILFSSICLLIACLSTLGQAPPVFEASTNQVSAGTVGAPFYVSPRGLAGAGFTPGGGGSTPNGLVTNSAAANVVITDGTSTTTITTNSITTGSGVFTNGAVSVIPTNAAPVSLVLSASGVSLPIGITNTFAGRAQATVEYWLVDAVTGVAKITFSNEMTSEKIFRSPGSLALVDTNSMMLTISTTNNVWRVRDESSGTGTSVGVLTNWWKGL